MLIKLTPWSFYSDLFCLLETGQPRWTNPSTSYTVNLTKHIIPKCKQRVHSLREGDIGLSVVSGGSLERARDSTVMYVNEYISSDFYACRLQNCDCHGQFSFRFGCFTCRFDWFTFRCDCFTCRFDCFTRRFGFSRTDLTVSRADLAVLRTDLTVSRADLTVSRRFGWNKHIWLKPVDLTVSRAHLAETCRFDCFTCRFRCFPKYGTSPLFGVYATVDVEGTVKVGDSVYVIRKWRSPLSLCMLCAHSTVDAKYIKNKNL